MIVVLDTNVFISGLIAPGGPSARIVAAWRAHRFDLGISDAILGEIAIVTARARIARLLTHTPEGLRGLLADVRRSAIHVEPAVVDAVPRDPPDNLVLGTAIAAGAAVLVTGNEHLLALGSYRGVAIVTPRQLLDRIDAPPA